MTIILWTMKDLLLGLEVQFCFPFSIADNEILNTLEYTYRWGDFYNTYMVLEVLQIESN